MANVLIATLGDSPIVVTSMYDLLTKQERLTIDRVIVLHTEGDRRMGGYLVIAEAIERPRNVISRELPFEDVYTEGDCFVFLHHLFKELLDCQEHGDTVYLSLAGGRKNMSALMALAAPFSSHIGGLYHVIDKKEYEGKTNFISADELGTLLNKGEKKQLLSLMHPDLDSLQLVSIPFVHALQIDSTRAKDYLRELSNMTAEQLQKRWEENPDQEEEELFLLTAINASTAEATLEVKLTEKAKEDFDHLAKSESKIARAFISRLKNMRSPKLLAANRHPREGFKGVPYIHYVYKVSNTRERPYFHTEPNDIAAYEQKPVKPVRKVIVERLPLHRSSETEYEPKIETLLATPYDSNGKLYSLEEVLNGGKDIRSILIVPMGTLPMIATQLYTLITKREHRKIQRVVLIYPGEAGGVLSSVQTAMQAFKKEKIPCDLSPVAGLRDILSRQDCERYQNALENLIGELRLKYPGSRIDLALTGGRKGMAVLALFAAQRTQLREIFHTLVADEELSDKLAEMDANYFKGLSEQKRQDILFLRAYKTNESVFRLFKVPIGPLHGI